MPDLVTRLKLANSEFNSSIDSSKEKVKQFQDTADDASKSLKDMGVKGEKSADEFLGSMSKFENGARSVTNYRSQLAQLQKEITDLTINYRGMTQEMQQSAKGLEIKSLIEEATQQAAVYKDAIMDVQQEIKTLASDTAAWDAMAMGIDTASSALQGFVSLGVLGEKSTEKLVEVIAKLKSIAAATNAVIKLGNALQKNSALMAGIAAAQSKALAKAKTLEAAATGKATIAMKAMNLVAKANPYLLLASAIATLVVGIGAYVAITNRATTASQDAAKATNNFKKALDEGKKEANETIAKFMVLQSTWKSLKTEAEKTEWIKKNQDAFKELGLNINNVNDAEKAFVTYSSNIIKAMALRAQAAKLQAKLVDDYQKALDKADKIESKKQNGVNGPYDFGTKKDWEKAGLIAGEDYQTAFIQGASQYGQGSQMYEYLTESGKEKMKAYAKQAAEDYMNEFEAGMQSGIDELNSLVAEADALEKPLGSIKENTDDVNDSIKAAADSLTAAEEKLSKMQSEFHAMGESDPGLDKMKQDVIEQEKLVERLKKKYDTMKKSGEEIVAHNSRLSQLKDELATLNKMEPTLKEGTAEWDAHYKRVAEIEKEIKNLEDSIEAYKKRINSEPLELVAPTTKLELPKFVTSTAVLDLQKKMQDAIAEANRQFKAGLIDKATLDEKIKEIEDRFNKTKLEIEAGVSFKPLSNEDKRALYDAKAEAASIIQKDFDLGLISPQQAKAQIANLNNELAKAGIKAEVGIDFHVDEEDLSAGLKKAVDALDSLNGFGSGIIGSFNDVYESISGLTDKLSEAENGWERFFAVFQTGQTILSSAASVIEAIATVMDLLNLKKEESVVASMADAAATKEDTQAHLENAGAKAAEAIAGASKSASEIPYIGWILAGVTAVSLLATLLSSMNSAKGFANGGIVPGNSLHGDKQIIRANSGEMVLNSKQQANLFKIIDQGRLDNRLTSGEVNFKIKGSDLVGTLSNYQNKRNKI